MSISSLHSGRKRVGIYSISILFLIYLFVMDFILFFRIRSRVHFESNSTDKNRDIFASLTVKKIFIGPIIQYVHSPLAELIEDKCHLTKHFPRLSPNHISIVHTFLSLISIKYLSDSNLSIRRIGVGIFQIRNFLDCLDGVVFRAQSNKHRYTSYYGDFGYFIDCLGDTFAGLCLLIVCGIELHRKRRRSVVLTSTNIRDIDNDQHMYRSMILFALLYSFSALSWNRFVYAYEQLLDASFPENYRKQMIQLSFLHTPLTISIFYLWRYISALSIQDYLLGAIFFDRLSEFIDKITHAFIVLLFVSAIVFTYFHIQMIRSVFEHL